MCHWNFKVKMYYNNLCEISREVKTLEVSRNECSHVMNGVKISAKIEV